MVDFKKRLKNKDIPKRTNPVEIYSSLDRSSETGPLRPSQEKILEIWFNSRMQEKNNIIKLHTGEGKTLIGLLMLQSKINSGEGPCLYLCPDKYLAEQVRQEAHKFGIPQAGRLDGSDLPDMFLDGSRILITHVQKVFNGKTIFGLNNKSTDVGSIVIDDSHACIDSIRKSLTLQIPKWVDKKRKANEHPLYSKIINLFSDDIREQGQGSFLEIESGDYNTMLPIPYWSWFDRCEEVTRAIGEYREDDCIKYVWPVIKDQLLNCQAFISGNVLEISPSLMPIDSFGSFSRAKNRILMSATTQDDSFFIKGLGFDIASIRNPLTNKEQQWSGEKMILIPSLINDNLDRDTVVHRFGKPIERATVGRVILTPSSKSNNQYEKIGASIANTDNIYEKVKQLKNGDCSQAVILVNRYDGIDLPDDSCRILILDSKPFFDSLLDRYEESCRANSDTINIRIAQKVEQGLGRSVRGEKDYSVILLVGGDLVKFAKSPITSKYFSSQTRKQIEIGMQVVSFANEDETEKDEYKVLTNLITQVLKRDEGWKEYYVEEMSSINSEVNGENIHNILLQEYKAEKYFLEGDFDKACEIGQELCDQFSENKFERDWYLQQISRYKYQSSKIESNKIQKVAFQNNSELLKPKEGINYNKIEFINQNRTSRIQKWLSQYKDYQEMMISIESILQDLTFGVRAEKFEGALKDLGDAIGFVSQRPDKEIKKGADNLWCGVENQYFLMECKSEVLETRNEITKYEAGQMNSHSAWFESEYGEALCKRILIIPTRNLSYYGDFTHEVEIMRKANLKKLKNNTKNFFKEFSAYSWREVTDQKIQEFIDAHSLDLKSLRENYSEKYYKCTQ